MRSFRLPVAVISAAACLAPLTAQSESADPPAGAPWTKSFFDAHRRAVDAGKPIFVYSTKTF